ncbi:PIN domain-containing protein [Rhodohalobacter sp. SW132]|uniref:PIN domain-containing protein n=1 Tax=Rhodohalobacter sp. SW132 TaxID=2293433 RepID=UPI000E22DA84|nr:PIN domain-containing protein [Rhodohalobacter sp. SW132]REL32989.1 PIN domain-containing protein [Rhodohalobacter sp. SW132]
MHSDRLRVILDACVLYPAPIRDLLLTFAVSGLFQPLWSEEIQDEWKRNLLANRTDLSSEQLNWTINRMNDSLPDANVTDYQHYISKITLPDKDDRHVVAAAIKGNADVIVTFNLNDFPRSVLLPFGIEPVHPDQFTLDVIDLDEKSAIEGFRTMVGRLRNPPLTNDDVLSALKKTGIRKGANKLQKLLD